LGVLLTFLAASFVATPTAAAVEVPEDRAVPPDIDLEQYNVVIGTDASETLSGSEGPDFIAADSGTT
jgi:hypothetical protein